MPVFDGRIKTGIIFEKVKPLLLKPALILHTERYKCQTD